MPKKKYLDEIFSKYYGHKELKNEQYEIINAVLHGNDVCAILPTGFGKSVCYQIPFLCLGKSIVVVSPLIALMDDQVQDLIKKGIPVCSLNSNNKTKGDSLKEIYEGRHKIIYTSPEYLAKNDNFIQKLYDMDLLGLIAVDEAHCVSAWGNDFRPDYQKLACIKDLAPTIPILALTATATKRIQDDICKFLRLDDPIFVTCSFDRPNLYLSIAQKMTDTFHTTVRQLLNKYTGKKVLIYCKSKDDTDRVANDIKSLGISCGAYHAGKTPEVRSKCQKDFTDGKISCIVATIAFGMGVNIPDIRLVIHYNCPSDMESYYQEIGRAGRDNEYSECHMFYSGRDFIMSKFFIDKIRDINFKRHRMNELNVIQQYVHSPVCRRNILLKHFDSTSDVTSCDMCDVCCIKNKKNTNVLKDCTKETNLFLNLLNKFDGSYGTNTFVKILRGSGIAKIIKFRDMAPLYYGKGIYVSEDLWKHIIVQLITQSYVSETNVGDTAGFGTVLNITAKGISVMHSESTIMLDVPNPTVVAVKKVEQCHAIDEIDLKKHCNNAVVINQIVGNDIKDSATINATYNLLCQKKTISEIANIRNLKPQTIEDHIVKLFEYERLTNLAFGGAGITKQNYDEIIEKTNKDSNLKTIRDGLKKKYSYLQIKLALCVSKMSNIKQDELFYSYPKYKPLKGPNIRKAIEQYNDFFNL